MVDSHLVSSLAKADGYMNKAIHDQIVSIIDDVDDMTIATVRPDGYPQATIVSYVNDGMTIYFGTTESAQKARNIAANDKVSITINRSYSSWDDIEGLSMAATAHRVTDGGEQQKVTRLMLDRFPQISKYESAMQGEIPVFYRVEPSVISVLDYRRGFGHTELVEV